MKVKNGSTKDDLKEKSWHKTFDTESSSNSELLHLQQALNRCPEMEFLARPIKMKFECLINEFCLLRWVLSIEYVQLLVTSKLRECVKRRCYA
jgi:hypothetical protein